MVHACLGCKASAEYMELLQMFSVDRPGLGPEAGFGDVSDQPMAVALVLQSEALRYRSKPNDDSARRIRAALAWLVAHSDDDQDGRPGWGLPEAWDAFSDGTVNPPNQPYTITTALVLEGLLDSAAIPQLWTRDERSQLFTLMRTVFLRWCQEAWTSTKGGGYFWYSTSALDAKFIPNVSSVMSGVGARLLTEHPGLFSAAELALLRETTDRNVRALVASATLRDGAPFWTYQVPVDHPDPNDLVHHVYILWGLEIYREAGGAEPITWSRTDSLNSVRRFWSAGVLHQLPSDEVYNNVYDTLGAEAWGAGMALAFVSRWGTPEDALAIRQHITTGYGDFPLIRRFPGTTDPTFYRRWTSHVLWGLAVQDLSTR